MIIQLTANIMGSPCFPHVRRRVDAFVRSIKDILLIHPIYSNWLRRLSHRRIAICRNDITFASPRGLILQTPTPWKLSIPESCLRANSIGRIARPIPEHKNSGCHCIEGSRDVRHMFSGLASPFRCKGINKRVELVFAWIHC